MYFLQLVKRGGTDGVHLRQSIDRIIGRQHYMDQYHAAAAGLDHPNKKLLNRKHGRTLFNDILHLLNDRLGGRPVQQ